MPKYIKSWDNVYIYSIETTKDALLAEKEQQIVDLIAWKQNALDRVNSDYQSQYNQLIDDLDTIKQL